VAEEQQQSAELRLKLVIDDQTSETVNRLRENLGGVEEHTHAIAGGTHEIAMGVFEGNAYWEAMKVTIEGIEEGVKAVFEVAEDLTKEAVHAADEASRQQRGMTGMLHLMDQGQHSMQAVADYAGEVREELEKGGLAAGVSTQTMTEMFSTIVERGHMSSEAAKELTLQMAEVGKITRGGTQGLAEGFAMMELGIVRARNPLVQLIATTGILHGNAKAVAAQLQKMTPEDQMKKAEEAVRRQAESLKSGGGVKLTMGEYRTSFEGYREMLFEAIGKPINNTLLPMLGRVQAWLAEHAEQIKEFGQHVGEKVAEWINKIAPLLEHAFDFLYSHTDDMMNALEKGATALYNAVEYIVAHKDLILAIGAAAGIGKGAGALAGALPGMGSALGRGVGAVGGVGSAVGLGVGAAANAVIWEQAAAQAHALEKESGLSFIDSVGHMLGGIVGATDDFTTASNKIQNFNAIMERMHDPTVKTSAEMKRLQAQMIAMSDSIAQGGASAEMMAMMEHEKQLAQSRIDAASQLEAFTKSLEMAAVASYDSDFAGPQMTLAERFGDVYKQMAGTNAAAADDAAKKILEGNVALVEALAGTGADVGAALEALHKMVKGDSLAGIAGRGGANINFNGASFQIHQDFKDQDPDRVIVAFRRDLIRHTFARVDARTNMGFGGL